MSDNELTKRLRGADEEIKKRNELINKLQEIVKKAQSGSIITRSEVIKAQNFNELLGGAFSDDVAIVESKVSEEESNKINQWALLHPEKPNLPMTIKEYFKREESKQVNNTLNKLASGEAVSNEELSKTAELLVDNSEQDLRKKLIEASEKDKEELAKKALSENRELTDDELSCCPTIMIMAHSS